MWQDRRKVRQSSEDSERADKRIERRVRRDVDASQDRDTNPAHDLRMQWVTPAARDMSKPAGGGRCIVTG